MKRATSAMAMALILSGCADRMEGPQVGGAVGSAPMPEAAAAPAKPPQSFGMPGGDKAAMKAVTVGRKIIHNARVDLITEDLAGLESRLQRLVEASKGYVADSEVSGKAGSRRDATWKVRVPVETYGSFVEAVKSLGELVSVREDAQDVSEEYFDLEARLANKKVEEQRLVKLLTEATGKLEEVLKVEKELSRVREEIERFEGRRRVLANLTSLATVTVSAREVRGYTPPQAPTFSTRIARRFEGSVDSIRRFGEDLVLFLVGAGPWIPVVAIVAAPFVLARRRIWRALTSPLMPTK